MAEIELAEFPDTEYVDTTCTICYAEFLEPEDLAVHISQMHTLKIRPTLKSCHFCTETLPSLEDYASHLLKEHMQRLKCCKYCTRVFDVYEEYRDHENKHYTYTAKSIYSCSQCKKLFNNIFELERHEIKEHFDAAEGVFINDCLSLLSSLLNIKALKFLQSLGDEVVYVCARCEETTPDPNDYLDHLKKKKCQSLVCDSCSSVYRNKKSLIRHVETHLECNTGHKNLYKQCLECFKMFDIRMWRDHTKHCKAIKCKTCNIVFGSMYDLTKHQITEHPSTVTLQACKFCHREFAGSICLQKHIERAHKHDAHLYKYICTCCNAIFKHPKRLFAHFYSTHKDLEPYTCKICDKKFKIRKKFTIHIKLDHKSIGYIEFDENYLVYFSDKKSDKPVTEDVVKSEKMKSESTIKDTEIGESGQSTKKVTFDIEEKLDDTFGKVNSDFMSATETEGNVTEIEMEEKKPKRKIKLLEERAKKRVKKSNDVIVCDSTDEDEPLIEIRKRVKKSKKFKFRRAVWNRKKNCEIRNPKQRFICNICSKNCYTFQNYHNHVALHYKNVVLKCVKCSESFNSQEDLNEHYSNEHSSSQLTQTLKNLLEKRKNGVQINSDLTLSERFQRTVKKVPIPHDNITVTLKEVANKLSVQKFIESFTPEEAPKKKAVEIECTITMKPYSGPLKESFINIHKCNLSHMDFSRSQLSMPVRFRQVLGETHKVTVKEVEFDETANVDDKNLSYENETYFDDDNIDRNESIPDVAQEVMLEVSEDPTPKTLYIPHKVVLPKLPKEYNKIRIAHLQAEAPFYKIVKVEDVLNSQGQEEKKVAKPEKPIEKNIKLPDGTKLVTVNPLAHLLGNTPVEKILEKSKNKYYQPKAKDFEMAIAKAMLRLEKPEAFPKKKRKKADVN